MKYALIILIKMLSINKSLILPEKIQSLHKNQNSNIFEEAYSRELLNFNFNQDQHIHHKKIYKFKKILQTQFFSVDLKHKQTNKEYSHSPLLFFYKSNENQGKQQYSLKSRSTNVRTTPQRSRNPENKSKITVKKNDREQNKNISSSNSPNSTLFTSLKHRKNTVKTRYFSTKIQKLCSQLQRILEASDLIKEKQIINREKLITVSDRNKILQNQYDQQKHKIIRKIKELEEEDRKKQAKATYSKDNHGEETKKKEQERKESQLTNLERYNLNYTSYLKNKTSSNLMKVVYDRKIRKKEHLVEKFNAFVMDDSKFSSDIKRRLERSFRSIEHEYNRPKRRKIIERRLQQK